MDNTIPPDFRNGYSYFHALNNINSTSIHKKECHFPVKRQNRRKGGVSFEKNAFILVRYFGKLKNYINDNKKRISFP